MFQLTMRENFDEWMIPVYASTSFIPVRGEGPRLWDQQRKEYIDSAGDTAMSALGHAHSELCEALSEQADKFWHTGNGYTNEPVLRLVKKLIDATFADRVLSCSSDTGANEAAPKLVRRFAYDRYGGHKDGIVTFRNVFHGRMLFTVSIGGQSVYSQDPASLSPGIRHAAYNDTNSAGALVDDATCAVIVEPIQGEDGVVPASNVFLRDLRESCDRHNALLIFGEIQTGVGYTRELYACMYYGVTSDLLITAEALGSGFPAGTSLATGGCTSVMTVDTYSITYDGNPLAPAVVSKVPDLINTPETPNGVKQRHNWFVECLNSINHHYSLLSEARGLGLLIDCVLNADYAGQAKRISREAAKVGVMVLIAGGNMAHFVSTLDVSEEEVTTGLDRFATVCGHSASRGSSW